MGKLNREGHEGHPPAEGQGACWLAMRLPGDGEAHSEWKEGPKEV